MVDIKAVQNRALVAGGGGICRMTLAELVQFVAGAFFPTDEQLARRMGFDVHD